MKETKRLSGDELDFAMNLQHFLSIKNEVPVVKIDKKLEPQDTPSQEGGGDQIDGIENSWLIQVRAEATQ